MFLDGQDQFETALTSIAALDARGEGVGDIIQSSLRAARKHLGLQVAYLSEFVGDETIFRSVDAPGLEHLIKPGDSRPLDVVYCPHILAGRLPELIADTAQVPLAAAMPITAAVPIGSHVSVPIRLAGGEIYGMFCCLGPFADPTLNERDLNVMRCFADMAASEIDRRLGREAEVAARRARVADVIAARRLAIHYQPIWDLRTMKPVGFEALSRFDVAGEVSPDYWFAEAHLAQLSAELELLAIALAIEGLEHLPGGAYLTVNCSPSTALRPELAAALEDVPLERLVLEVTEHENIEDVTALVAALAPLRQAGMRVAVDDAGAGYSGLQQILDLRPEIIKLDRFFVRSIEDDPVRRALAAALARFSQDIGCAIVGEGVETPAELDALREVGFDKIQGYLLGRPAPIDRLDLTYDA